MRRFLSILLTVSMLASMFPMEALAAGPYNDEVCPHHAEHTEDCGYVPASAGAPCTHEHTEDCFALTGECAHEHDETCGYAEPVDGVPCNFFCEICAGLAEEAGAAEKPVPTPEPGVVAESTTMATEGDTCVLTFVPFDENTPALYAATVIDENAIRLQHPNTLSQATLSYWWGGNWVDITTGNENLPANTSYQFEFSYQNVSVDALKEAGGQMIFDDLPDWFIPAGGGMLMNGGQMVAIMEVVDGALVITFDRDWLEQHETGDKLIGTFKVGGTLDWRYIFLNDVNNADSPDWLDPKPQFEGDLPQKYGELQLKKSEPELIHDGENYYLRYTLTVTSGDTVPIPQVSVRDSFGGSADIDEYVLPAGSLPDSATDETSPWEKRLEQADAGTLTGAGGEMVWSIGTMQPLEERTLTYCAQIDPSYVASLTNNTITNTASLYAGDVFKQSDRASFASKNGVDLKKSVAGSAIDPITGSGTITYSVTITARADNSFTLKNLTLSDAFPAEFLPYLSGDQSDGSELEVTIAYSGNESKAQIVNYAGGTFALDDISLMPGQSATVTYVIHVKNLYLAYNGGFKLTNAVNIASQSGRELARDTHEETLPGHKWIDKKVSTPLAKELTITIDTERNFTVPAGSVKYVVEIDKDGRLDLSKAMLTDAFDSQYLQYVGYMEIELYDPNSPQTVVTRTWMDIDGQKEFSFPAGELGLEGGPNYACRLTYYAKPVGVENIGSAIVNNTFAVKGPVTLEDTEYNVNLEDVATTPVDGHLNYNVQKTSWYYASAPVYMKDGTYTSETNPAAVFKNDYTNGAIYWVIRLEGEIPTSGFFIKDQPASTSGDSGHQFKRDSLMGIFVGDQNFDFSNYESYPAFMEAYPALKEAFQASESGGLKQLSGNPQNDKFFKDTVVDNPEYEWYAENRVLERIQFSADFIADWNDVKDWEYDEYNKENEAIYVVLRTVPVNAMPTTNGATRTYTNHLSISGQSSISTADFTYKHVVKKTLFKESKSAYVYENGAFTKCANVNPGDWYVDKKTNPERLPGDGIYAAWLLNVNYDGTLDGTYDVVDQLPEGMELVYVDVNNYGNAVKNDLSQCPRTTYISELNGNNDWDEMEATELDDRNRPIRTITYYNKETREIRWRIENLTSSGEETRREINLRIICRIVDPELFLNQTKTYTNQAQVLEMGTDKVLYTEQASVTVTVPVDKRIDDSQLQSLAVDKRGNEYMLGINRLPFIIHLNPRGDDILDGDVLPTLMDQLSPGVALVESSLKVSADGADWPFTYDVDEDDNGQQTILIHGLPDGKAITITYHVRLTGKPGSDNKVTVTNTAYWQGYSKPAPQVTTTAWYDPSGDSFVQKDITIKLIKVDADSHSLRLNGAEFIIYPVDKNGNKLQDIELKIGPTDSLGEVVLYNTETKLEFSTVYCLEETNTPTGYHNNEGRKWYFAIVKPGDTFDPNEYTVPGPMHVWYEGTKSEYELVVENVKGSISMELVFVGADGQVAQPTPGTYKFGLYSFTGVLRQTLTIEYAKDGTAKYYLDGRESDKTEFTKFEPDKLYRIYELDADGVPIIDGGDASLNGKDFCVTYSADQVARNGKITIWNMLPGEGRLTVSKSVAGDYADKSKDFTFTVSLQDAGGNPLPGGYPLCRGGSDDPEGHVVDGSTFQLKHGESVTISGLPASAKYTVTEAEEPGYTATITGNSTGEITADGESVSFINTYSAEEVTASVPELTKALTGRDLVAEEFTFELTANSTEGITLPGVAKNDVDGKVKFGNITFTKIGTYIVTIKEKVPAEKYGVTYDTHEVKITYEVKDDGKGNLYVDGDPSVIGENTFNNTYSASSVTAPVPEFTKKLTGRTLIADEFEFEITANSTGGIILPGAAKNDVNGKVKFGNITFTKMGTYTVTIKEKVPTDGTKGVTYDTSAVTITYEVKDDGKGNLYVDGVPSVTGNKEFKNTYSASSVTASVPELTKTLTGRTLVADEFEFEITASSTDGIILPSTARNAADGKVNFEDITFTKIGTYTVTIKEKVPTDKKGVGYDIHEVTITYEVKDDGKGSLYVEGKPSIKGNTTFNNTYSASSVTASVPVLTKKLTGRTLVAEEFEFEITAGATEGITLPSAAKNTADGKVNFEDITFTKIGTYTVTIKEKVPTEKYGVTYDTHEVKITYEVKDDGKGSLYVEGVPSVTGSKEFKNTYSASSVTASVPELTKTLTGRDLVAGEFEFEITADATDGIILPSTAKNAASGKVNFEDITFTKIGTYTVTIKEKVPTDKKGVGYDTHEVKITYEVKDDGKGNLYVDADPSVIGEKTFSNTYSALSVTASVPELTKTLTGRDLVADEFEFEITASSTDGIILPSTAKNTASGKVNFEDITFTKIGMYTVTIKEKVPTDKKGVGYDIHEVTITYEVKDDGKGKLYVEGKPSIKGNTTFNNTYSASSVTASVPELTKTLTGRDLVAGEFEFEITADATDGIILPSTAKNAASGKVNFEDITFTKIGTYTVTIKEKVPTDKKGVGYDTHEVKITYEVKDDGKGNLYVDADPSVIGEKTFSNTYSALSVTASVPELTKTLTGRDLVADEFEFEITASSTDGIILPSTAKNTVSGKVNFGNITFTKIGTYVVTIKEKVPTDKKGVGYDTHEVKITYEVKDDGKGKLYVNGEPGVTGSKEFKNTYSASSVTASVPELTKTLTGRDLVAGEFEFEITANVTEGIILPSAAKNTADGKVKFGSITFTKIGTYVVTIKEKVPTDKKGVGYDTHEVKIIYEVKDDGKGNLYVDGEPGVTGSKEFKNTYSASSVTASVPELTKTLTGRDLVADEFEFEITANSTDDIILPSTAKNTADGKVNFGNITFTKIGTYTVTIKEKVPTDKKGVGYDTHEVKITYEVKDDGKGKLYVNGEPGVTGSKEFKNTYSASSVTASVPELTKTLTGRALVAGEFEFEITTDATDGITLPGEATNDASGKVNFGNITFTKIGTYVVTIKEKVPTDKKGVGYDTHEVKITYEVKDDGKGNLYVEGDPSVIGEKTFNNTYSASSVTASVPELTKTLTGRTLVAEEFEFEITANATEGIKLPSAAKNTADGKVNFEDITFTKIGTYVVTIKEKVPTDKKGVGYDTHEVKITYEVKDDGKGNLYVEGEPSVTGSKEFKNTYVVRGVTAYFSGMKTLRNAAIVNGQFSFTLMPVGDAPMPESAVNGTQTVKNGEDGAFTFSGITYSRTGTYKYLISEEIPATPDENVIYDDHVYTAVVEVTDNRVGQLLAEVKYYEGNFSKTDPTGAAVSVTFTNTAYATGGFTVKKVLTGRGWSDEDAFSATVTLTEGNADKVMRKNGDAYVPFISPEIVTFTRGDASEFFDLRLGGEGVYTFEVRENLPEAAKGQNPYQGITYDKKTHTVTVTVTDDGHGNLTVSSMVDGADGGSVPTVTIQNTYAVSAENLIFNCRTVFENSSLSGDDFMFVLEATDGAPMPDGAENGKLTVNNLADGSITFRGIVFDAPGGPYEYTIREVIPDPEQDDIIYDRSVYKVVVTVTDDGKGNLAVEVVITKDGMPVNGDILFTNVYDPMEVSVPLWARVEFQGGMLEADLFKFELDGVSFTQEEKLLLARITAPFAARSESVMPDREKRIVKNGTDGTIDFGQVAFTQPGTYTFKLYQVEPDGGWQNDDIDYDDTVYTITVTVTKENRTLHATVAYDPVPDNTEGMPVFVNRMVESEKPTEPDVPPAPDHPTNPDTPTIPDDKSNGSQNVVNAPQTGDNSDVVLWWILLLMSLGGMMVTMFSQKKMKRFGTADRHIK